jgi:DNA-binding transcriptional ArsR family regulator
MPQSFTEPLEPLLSALAHPTRARVLGVLSDRPASAAEIAEETGTPIARVRYHLRALARAGMIDWAKTEERRGVKEYYWVMKSPQWVEDEQISSLSKEQNQMINLHVLRLIFADAAAGLREEAFARRPDHAVVRYRLLVDEKGWKELVKIVRTALDGIDAVRKRAGQRLSKSGEDPLTVSATLLLFDLESPAHGLSAKPEPTPDGGWKSSES